MSSQAINSSRSANNPRGPSQFRARLANAIFNGQRKTLYLSDSFPHLHLFLPKEMRINGDLSGKELENITFELDRLASVYGSERPYGNHSLERIQNLYRFLVAKLSEDQLPQTTAEPLTAKEKLVAIFSDRKFQAALAICTLISGITGGFFALATLILVVSVLCILISGYVGTNIAAAHFEHAQWERAQILRQIRQAHFAPQISLPVEPKNGRNPVPHPIQLHPPHEFDSSVSEETPSPMSISQSDSQISIPIPSSPGVDYLETSPRSARSDDSVSSGY